MKYGLYSDSKGIYSIHDLVAKRGWTANDGIEDAIHNLELGRGWPTYLGTDPDLAIHILDFDSLPQLKADHPEIFI